MKKRTLVVAVVAALGIVMTNFLFAQNDLVWSGDFETGDFSQWRVTQGCNDEAVKLVAAADLPTPKPYGTSRYASRHLIDDACVWSGNGRTFDRAEVGGVVNSTDGYPDGQPDADLYYGWSVYWPQNYPREEGYQLFAQWKGAEATDPATGKTVPNSPPLSMIVDNDIISFRRTAPQGGGVTQFWTSQLERGKWYAFVAHIKHSNRTAAGFVELWVNGNKVVTNTCQAGNPGCGGQIATLNTDPFRGSVLQSSIKAGLYRLQSISSSQVVYQDDWKIGRTFDVVNPMGGGNTDTPPPAPTPSDRTPPLPPTNVRATQADNSSLRVSWSAAVDEAGGSGIDMYRIYRTDKTAVLANLKALDFRDVEVTAGQTYTYQVSAVDKAGNESAKVSTNTITLPKPVGLSPKITAIKLINADTNKPLVDLTDNLRIDRSKYKTFNYNVDAQLASAASVRFRLDAGVVERIESRPPYALAGDDNGRYLGINLEPGRHTLTATPYAGKNGTGAIGSPVTVNFVVYDSKPYIESVKLLNAKTGRVVADLKKTTRVSQTISKTSQFSLEARLSSGKSVKFKLDNNYYNDSTAPFIFEDLKGSYIKMGKHTLLIRGYSDTYARGQVSEPYTAIFEITR